MGIFEEIMAEMVRFYDKRRRIRWKWQAADGKNCAAPLGGDDTGRNPTNRGTCGSKIHLLVDRRGAPLAVYVSAANRHDKCSLQDLVCSMVVDRPDSQQHLCLDRGYGYDEFPGVCVLGSNNATVWPLSTAALPLFPSLSDILVSYREQTPQPPSQRNP
jgi:putative transposase